MRGVIAHEIAHIRNRDVTIATVAAGLAAVISGIANALQFSAFFGGSSDDEEGGGSIVGALLFALRGADRARALVQMAISRSREYVARRDGGAADRGPGGVGQRAGAAGLRRGSHPGAGSSRRPPASTSSTRSPAAAWPSLFSTHPPMEDADRAPARAAGGRTPGGVSRWTCSSRSPSYWWVYAAFTAGVLACWPSTSACSTARPTPSRSASRWPGRRSGWRSRWPSTTASTATRWPSSAAEVATRVGLEFLTGYLVEKALAVDNVFVFVLVFGYFGVPARYQHRVLFYGILGALVFRAMFVALGAVLMQYHAVVVAFGVILLVSGVKMMLAPTQQRRSGAATR